MFPTELVFIDIETTALAGPDADTDAIIEIAAARVDLKTRAIDAWSTLVRPARVGEPGAAPYVSFPTWVLGDFHAGRYDNVDWQRDGVTINDALQLLEDQFLRPGVTIAGQNPSFDLRYLRRDWEAVRRLDASQGGTWPAFPKLDHHVIDLVSPAFLLAMTGATPGCSLRHTIPIARPGVTPTHRAMQDVLDTIAVFWMLADMMERGWNARASRLFEPRGAR